MANSDSGAFAGSLSPDSSPDIASAAALQNTDGDSAAAASWIAALSSARIPSPPVQYDPRLAMAWRISGPETPTPHTLASFLPTGRARVQSNSETSANEQDSSAHASYPSSPSSSPTSTLSRSTSCTSSFSQVQEVFIPDIPVRPFISTLSKRAIQPLSALQPRSLTIPPAPNQPPPTQGSQQAGPSHVRPVTLLAPAVQGPIPSNAPVAGPSSTQLQAHLANNSASTSQLTRRIRPVSAHFAPEPAAALSVNAATNVGKGKGVSKLSRQSAQSSYISPTTGKKKPALSRHAHKRSFSVQWQQYERWESKSRARLRDLLILLLVSLCAAGGIYKLCAPVKVQPGYARSESAKRPVANKRAASVPMTRLADLDHPERDTVVLYRILGNDLPPRHERGQVLRNLRFMLSQESDFSFLSNSTLARYPLKVEKYYVLNRITDEDSLDGITALFEEFGVPRDRVLSIPFEWEGYRNASLLSAQRWDGGVADPTNNLWDLSPVRHDKDTRDIGLAEEQLQHRAVNNRKWTGLPLPVKVEKQRAWEELRKLRALEYTLHDKNLYAINNNGGRNFALDHGLSLPHARWILPLDGNCFFTPSAMASLFQRMLGTGEGSSARPYMIIPMTRLLDNSAVLPDNSAPALSSTQDPLDAEYAGADSQEEPQIGFRFDTPSEARYQEAMRYGRRSKLELLWRMGAVPLSKGLHEKQLAWEKEDLQFITAASHGELSRRSDDEAQTVIAENAGWVHRLFSGKREQEESSAAALQLRRVSRMKGIIAHLEDLDERAARGEGGACLAGEAGCGFRKDRLWSWSSADLAVLKRDAQAEPEGAASRRIRAFEVRTLGLLTRTQAQLAEFPSSASEHWTRLGAVDASRTCARLALVGYLTGNTSYAETAAHLLKRRLLNLHAAATHGHEETQSEHLLDEHTYAGLDVTVKRTDAQSGYAFPPFAEEEKHHLWQRMRAPLADGHHLPYDALHFDPTLVLDALRLLGPSYQPKLHLGSLLPAQAVRSLCSHQLAALLLSREGLDLSASPRNAVQAARYDHTVAALAGFLDDAKLLGRVLDRHVVRYLDPQTGQPRVAEDEDAREAETIRRAMLNGAGNAGYPIEVEKTDRLDPVFHL